MSKSASQSSWNFQWTGYIPVNTEVAAGYRLLQNAWANKRYLYIERHLANGDTFGGTAIVTAFSDQVSGAGYVQYQATFEGHEIPRRSYGNGLTVTADPPVVILPAPPQLANEPTAVASGTEPTVGEPITLTASV